MVQLLKNEPDVLRQDETHQHIGSTYRTDAEQSPRQSEDNGFHQAQGDLDSQIPPSSSTPVGLLPPVSVIIPTRNEAENIHPLLQRLLPQLPVGSEVIFVDDSNDDTPQRIQVAALQYPIIRLLHRPPGARSGGLGGAVLDGLQISRCDWVAVMDADLQHPPELLPRLVAAGHLHQAEIVIASRYRENGQAHGLHLLRLAISRASTTLARLAFPRRLRHVTDPLNGFFLLRRKVIKLDQLQPRGFKILLEILVRNPHLRVAEVSYVFGSRYARQSKAGLREGSRYLTQLATLRFGEERTRFAGFATVGLSGLVVNSLALFAMVEFARLHYLSSRSSWCHTRFQRLELLLY